ncbi:hypothetical protein RB195_006892 [Necator americanus]|uniref:Uncharacterized protein n=1 Tax=Necator americanus TaxID=51031 RepID=A0ABR1BUP2_NECAM
MVVGPFNYVTPPEVHNGLVLEVYELPVIGKHLIHEASRHISPRGTEEYVLNRESTWLALETKNTQRNSVSVHLRNASDSKAEEEVCLRICDFCQFQPRKPLRRKLRRQLQQDREDEWKSGVKKFEKAWEEKNPQKAYPSRKQYSGKIKRCSPALKTDNEPAIDETTLPMCMNHFNVFLNQQLDHVHGQRPRPTRNY